MVCFINHERLHHSLTVYQGRGSGDCQTVALHWRALLYECEKRLETYNLSHERTLEILRDGFEQTSNLLGINSTFKHMNQDLVQKAEVAVISFASKLADMIKTGFFSANLEVTRIEPGAKFDKNTMDCVGKGAGIVAGTIYLGLNRIGADGRVEILVKPKVLLV